MHKSSAVTLSCLSALLVPVAAQDAAVRAPAAKTLTFDDVRRPIAWVGKEVVARHAWDGRHVEVEEGERIRWFDPVSRSWVDPKERPEAGATEVLPPTAWRAVIHEGDVWRTKGAGSARLARRFGRMARGFKPGEDDLRLTDDRGAGVNRAEAHVSADGAFVSYVQDGDLWIVPTDGGEPWQVKSEGHSDQLHGMLDWVYQEEIYGRGDFQGHWWSPAGDMVAWLGLDEAPVREFTVVDHVPRGFLDRERAVVAEVTNYPKAGDPNPLASVSIAHVAGRTVVPVDLSAYPEDVLVVRVEWTPDQSTLLLTLQDRIQTWAELCAVDPKTGGLTRWIREESDTWVNRPGRLRWLLDGSFLWMSERTGYQHVYWYERGGLLRRQVTEGEWQVRSILEFDEESGDLWFEGTRDGATGRNYYLTNLRAPMLIRVTPGQGTHRVELSEDRATLIDRWSAMDRLPAVRLLDARTGDVLVDLGQADRGVSAEYEFSARQRLTVPARDGYELDACVMVPAAGARSGRSPVYLPTYSGPDAPSVRDSWSHSTYHQFLCQQGFVVLQVNVRTASGRGQKHTGLCYGQLGVQELRDLEDAVAHVCEHFGGDTDRVAIEGWSYGGFMAAYALTHSDRFALGIAGAGVHDWRLYDTIYTERYMRTPQENQGGYDRTSVIKAAANLQGHLVLLHGSMDDNVHLQNTMQLVWELQKAGKQNFEMMIYPRSRHGLAREVSGHRRDYSWSCLQRLLDE